MKPKLPKVAMPKVTHIKVEMMVDGKPRKVEFTGRKQILDLMAELGSLGAFLRSLAVAPIASTEKSR